MDRTEDVNQPVEPGAPVERQRAPRELSEDSAPPAGPVEREGPTPGADVERETPPSTSPDALPERSEAQPPA